MDAALQETSSTRDAMAPAGGALGASHRHHEAEGIPPRRTTELPRIQDASTRRVPGLDVRLKRAYEAPSLQDGLRILVDRLWPRGVRKADAGIDLWEKDLAPSTRLRQWFGHEPQRWQEFQRLYVLELQRHATTLEGLRRMARQTRVTLVYAARDQEHNEAVVLRDVLLGRQTIPHRRSAR